MVIKQYKLCDYCDNSDLNKAHIVHSLSLRVGWISDPARGGSLPDTKEYDLCETCLSTMLLEFFKTIVDIESNRKIACVLDKYRRKNV